MKPPPKPVDPADRWQFSATGEQGAEWVDSGAPPPAPLRLAPRRIRAITELPEVSTGGWLVSSFDLLSGADVVEEPDNVPADLFDELFPAPAQTAKVK